MENNFVKNNPWWRPAMLFYAKVTGWIALPLVVALLVDYFLLNNNKNNTWFFVCIILGFCVTCYGIYREIKEYKKNLYKNGDK